MYLFKLGHDNIDTLYCVLLFYYTYKENYDRVRLNTRINNATIYYPF